MRFVLILAMAFGIAPVYAQTLTAPDVEAFLDGVMPLQLQREDIAGAVIVVVKDGQILFEKGYGYSDVDKRTPVTADATLFRPGSISKLFTWTSIMQLVERKKLDLDRDVNDYIDFKIPSTYPKPITLRTIMTHTAGFEEAIKDLFVADAKNLKPLGDYLKAELPARVFPPGTTPADSNYATAVAGYIVQRVSGESYYDYVERHILQPRNESHHVPSAASRRAAPDDVEGIPGRVQASEAVRSGAGLAGRERVHHGGRHGAVPDRASPGWPLREHSDSPTRDGAPDALGAIRRRPALERHGARLLRRDAQRPTYHRSWRRHDLLPQRPASDSRGERRIFRFLQQRGQGPDQPALGPMGSVPRSIFPVQGLGSEASRQQRRRCARGFRQLSGGRRPQTSILSFISAVGITKVTVNSDGTISMGERDLAGNPKHFREAEPLVFRELNGQGRVAFKKDPSGRMVMGVDFPFMVFEKASWENTGIFENTVIFGCLGVLALTVLLWPAAALIRWHYGRPLKLLPAENRRRLLVRIVCLADVAFALIWIGLLSGLGDPGKLTDSLDPMLRLVQIIGWIGVIGTLIALFDAWTALGDRNRWWWSRLHAIAVAIACVGFTWFLYHWHMLHFSLKY